MWKLCIYYKIQYIEEELQKRSSKSIKRRYLNNSSSTRNIDRLGCLVHSTFFASRNSTESGIIDQGQDEEDSQEGPSDPRKSKDGCKDVTLFATNATVVLSRKDPVLWTLLARWKMGLMVDLQLCRQLRQARRPRG